MQRADRGAQRCRAALQREQRREHAAPRSALCVQLLLRCLRHDSVDRMDTLVYDVLLVGGGGAGLRAAISIAEAHPKLRLGLVSKVYPMRSHTVAAEGGAAAVIKDNDSLEDHIYDTISGADWLADRDATRAIQSVGVRVDGPW